MSARAAWRLESLGYTNVYDYAAGKVDWQANGLPTEGPMARELRIGAIAVTDVPTCRPDQTIGDLHLDDDLCVVVNDEGVILGDLRGKALRADPDTRVTDVMNPAPITYRPNLSVHEMAHQLVDNPARRVLVSDADGHLLGVLHRDDVQRAQQHQT
jgi:CBS domain-containing protein